MLHKILFKKKYKECPWCYAKTIKGIGGSKKYPVTCSSCHKQSYQSDIPDLLVGTIDYICFFLLIYFFFAENYLALVVIIVIVFTLTYLIFCYWPQKKISSLYGVKRNTG